MLLVIFGAGASYDSLETIDFVHHRPAGFRPPPAEFRPPLAAGLFENREVFDFAVELYSDAAQIERYLSEVQQEAEKFNDFSLVRQLRSLRFYIRDVVAACETHWPYPGGRATNYTLLVEEIRKWQTRAHERVLYVTFNYDTLPDRACELCYDASFSMDGMDSYTANPNYRLIKLHGSTNWRRRFLLPANDRIPFKPNTQVRPSDWTRQFIRAESIELLEQYDHFERPADHVSSPTGTSGDARTWLRQSLCRLRARRPTNALRRTLRRCANGCPTSIEC